MSFAMNAAKPMHEAAAALGVDPLYTALPSYVVIMGGGALVNLGFCFIRLAKVKNLSIKADFSLAKPLIISNILLSALGGLMWYLPVLFLRLGPRQHSGAVRLHELDAAYELLRAVRRPGGSDTERVGTTPAVVRWASSASAAW
ncbi:L-rhamnose-proton symporter [Klebsiella michiganensis]|uniref:L-rhamnose-proton symporter n=1 Tax=Klebsiella michiganensis TaxID=1134687 RepID=A0A7H4PEC0_9ENTR|nr:L-rhamnose-proton symporter [Klebsiella michiganensis]